MIKHWFLKILLVIASVVAGCAVANWAFAGASNYGLYNTQGASGAQIAVGTSATKVLGFNAGRQFGMICNTGTAIEYCAGGPVGGFGVTPPAAQQPPSPAPTSVGANGTPVYPNTCLNVNQNSAFTPAGQGLGSQSEWDCACATASSCATNTMELP